MILHNTAAVARYLCGSWASCVCHERRQFFKIYTVVTLSDVSVALPLKYS